MNYTIYSFLLKFYSIFFGLYYSYIKKTTLSRGSFKQERIYFFREYLYSNINAINNPSPPKNSTQPQ